MGGKKLSERKRREMAVKAGAAGVILSVILLLPCAAAVYAGSVELQQSKGLVMTTAIAGAFISHVILPNKRKGRGVLVDVLVSEGTYMAAVIIMSFGVPGGRIEWSAFLPVIIGSMMGNVTGAFINFNKTYNRERVKRKGYTKSNHLKKFT